MTTRARFPRRPDVRLSLGEAAALVRSGQTLALGGNMLYRRPVTFVRALLRQPQPPTDLTLLCFTAGYESDLLVGAGCLARTRTCYFGLEAFGLAPMFSQAAGQGTLEIVEETEASLAAGIRAALAGIDFLPSAAWIGTDLPALRPDVKAIVDPYSGAPLTAFPAIPCDVAVIHALVADRRGNARLNNNLGIDPELAFLAREVIVTAEEIVESLDSGVHIPGVLVTGVVAAPRGAWPTSCYPHYPVGGGEILRYLDACNAGQFNAYLDEITGQAR